MRLALQATFDDLDGTTDESRRRRARCERELEQNQRSFAFYRRLNSVVNDPNVKAPEVFAKESFPDPNVVAEYLDYRSESEEIASEYERACWDSTEALAEVGDCYDILSNDLPKQIVAPKNCRRRLYYVAWEESARSFHNDETNCKTERNRPLSEEFSTNLTEDERKEKASTSLISSAKKDEKRQTKVVVQTSSPKRESDVQRAMRKERSVKRRLRGYAVNTILLLCVLAFGIWALSKAQNDRRSETFQLATDQKSETNSQKKSYLNDSSMNESKVAQSNSFDDKARWDEGSKQEGVLKVADLRGESFAGFESETNFDAMQDGDAEPNPFNESDGDVLEITHVDVAPTDSEFPSVSVTSATNSEFAETKSEQTDERKRVRIGLRGGLNGARMKSVEIPAQNNDVFAPIQRY